MEFCSSLTGSGWKIHRLAGSWQLAVAVKLAVAVSKPKHGRVRNVLHFSPVQHQLDCTALHLVPGWIQQQQDPPCFLSQVSACLGSALILRNLQSQIRHAWLMSTCSQAGRQQRQQAAASDTPGGRGYVEPASTDQHTVRASTSKLSLLFTTGFKSFRDRAVIGPLADFTCVVGPNGCGKSVVVSCSRPLRAATSLHMQHIHGRPSAAAKLHAG